MSLREYRRKRDFDHTAEPAGDAPPRSTGRRFVVQKHAARRLHYDFRLELDGVLKSWAVPKGPSLDPAVRALAVEVEDHPLEYATFEGIIPKGQYGGGTVMVWDHGEWEPQGNAAASLKKGRLKFTLSGEKLCGGWSLVRMKDKESSGERNWLLIKQDDDFSKGGTQNDVTEERPASVLTGRTLDEIADDADRVWSSNGRPASGKTGTSTAKHPKRKPAAASDVSNLPGARKASLPREFAPQLATAAARIPDGDDWLHELKFDGYRLLCFIDGNDVRLLTRRGNNWTDRFPSVVEAARELGLTRSVLDGELVALDAHGVSDFQRLQNWMKGPRRDPLTYYVFDVPYYEGYSLQRTPLIERKELLARMLLSRHPANDGVIRYSDHIRGQGPEVLQHSCRHELEGVVSKRFDSSYENRRSRSWIKTKCQGRQEFVIGGFTKPQGSRTHFGALLIGYRDGDSWVYCGRVGTGFTQQTLRDLGERLRAIPRQETPFRNPPTGTGARGVTWVEPQLVAEVEFTEWTEDGVLRHPSFQGLREDKTAAQVVRERGPARPAVKPAKPGKHSAEEKATMPSAAVPSNTVAGVALSSPDRVLYPEHGLTKLVLARYYESIADWVLPHIIDRPLTLVRCPRGRGKNCFYQKHWTDSLPESVDSVAIREKAGKEPYVVIHDLAGLISLVQMNVLELHPWGSRTDRLERPDLLVFDLDPGEEVEWESVQQAAVEIRDVLAEGGLESFARTSGGKGLHVVVPLTRRNTWEDVGDYTQQIASGLAKQSPQRYVANMRKALRRGRIFIDYHRNRRGSTSIASYSTRARPGAPVATPVAWDELGGVTSPDQWTVANVPARLHSLTADPWEGFSDLRQSITRKARRAGLALLNTR